MSRFRRVVALVGAAAVLAACGGRGPSTVVQIQSTSIGQEQTSAPGALGPGELESELPPPGLGASTTGTSIPSTDGEVLPTSTIPSTPPGSDATFSAAGSASEQIAATYQRYLYLFSGLDSNLNSSWVLPLSQVTTQRLAEAVVRQASALLHSRGHAVGEVTERRLTIKMTGATTASVADCEDYESFYLVDDSTAKPDPGIVRGYFVGTAQLVKVDGRWLVDVVATTHATCRF